MKQEYLADVFIDHENNNLLGPIQRPKAWIWPVRLIPEHGQAAYFCNEPLCQLPREHLLKGIAI